MTLQAEMRERMIEAAIAFVLLQNENRPMTTAEIQAAIAGLDDLDFVHIAEMAAREAV